MTKKRKDPTDAVHQNLILTIAPDTTTSEYLRYQIRGERLSVFSLVADEGGFSFRFDDVRADDVRALVIFASPEMGTAQLELATQAIERQIPVIAWGFDHSIDLQDPAARDRLLLNTLLIQRGAALITDPCCISAAFDLLEGFPAFNRDWTIVTGALPPALRDRLASDLETNGLPHSVQSPSTAEAIEVALDGSTWLLGQSDTTISLSGGPRQIAEALSLAQQLAAPSPPKSADADLQPTETPPEVDIFLRPPTRILSETASKRLAAHFGISFPTEDLCQSATEAVRFAAGLGDRPVVVKLVRPEIDHKEERNLVIKEVSGPAEIKKAIRALSRRASELGPPEPLGFLVAPQVSGGVRLWACLSRDSRLGSVLLFGAGDVPGVDVLGAVDTSATIEECARVLSFCCPEVAPDAQSGLADVLGRLCNMSRQLAPHATRVEAHPIVYLQDENVARALDMLVEITA